MSTLQRELCGIVSALQTYEHYIIGSPFPIYVYCDHKPILYLWGRKEQLLHRFFWYQEIITKFQNLKIIWTPGLNLAFPDILSRNVTVEEYQMHQLRHKSIPRDIEFFDEHGTPVTYQIQHEDNPNDTCNDFYPIKYKRGNEEKILRLQNDGENFTVSSMLDDFPITSIQQASDCFRVSEWEDLSTNLDKNVGQRPNQMHLLPHPIRTIVQSIPLARPKMTQQTPRAPAMTQYRPRSWQYCVWYQYSNWPSPTLSSQTSSRLGARENWCFLSHELPNNFWCSSPEYQSINPETWRSCEDSRSWCINRSRGTNEGSSTWRCTFSDS